MWRRPVMEWVIAFFLLSLFVTTTVLLIPEYHVILPKAEALIADAIQVVVANISTVISALIIMSILFHAGLVGDHVRRELRKYWRNRHPIWLGGAVAASAALIAVAAVPEIGHLVGDLMA